MNDHQEEATSAAPPTARRPQRPPDVLTGLQASESGMPADSPLSALTCSFVQREGWRPNRIRKVIPNVIPRLHPQRKPLCAQSITGEEANAD